MERYIQYSAPDFVLDDNFVAWIRDEDPQVSKNWETWLLTNPEKKEEIQLARQLLLSLDFKTRAVGEPELDKEWKLVQEGMATSNPGRAIGGEEPTRSLLPKWSMWAAASVVIFLLAWFGRDYLPFSITPATELAEKRALNGQQLTVKLMDGTTVVLNAGSTLRYPEQFPNHLREVQLSGEAYFEVAPNTKAPFLIVTDDVRVRVVGTKFTVKAYPENKEVKVAVVEGKVAVNPSDRKTSHDDSTKQVYLIKDEMATIVKVKQNIVVTGYDKNDLLGWKNGVLYFEKADFTQFVNRLERWYGVQIDVDEQIVMDPDWRFSGKFENKSIDYILDVCRYPNRFTYKLSENKVYINK